MTWDQVAELRDAGMGVGGHSLTHPVLAQLPREEQEREIEGCRARLQEALGLDMTSFSYPVGLPGCFDEDTKDLLRRAGVRIAFAFSGGYVRLPVTDALEVPRAGVTATMSRERFGAMLALPQVFSGW
jgi:peptidoglycan/xylan/chitin deacetylase (PgdA/CDA1 family)